MKINFYEHNLKNQKIINKVLKSTYLTSGPICQKVEKKIAKRFNKKKSLLTNSWTNAVIGILKSLNLKPTDEVIIPNLTFVACANVVEMVGAKVVFADIDKKTLLMSVEDCVKKITKNTKVIMPVHLYGSVANLKEIKKIINNKKIYLIDDCSQAHGAYDDSGLKKKKIGSATDISCFSLYPGKNLGAYGDAGIITTNNKYFCEKLKKLRNLGSKKNSFMN